MTDLPKTAADIEAEAEENLALLGNVKAAIGETVFGQERVIEETLCVLLAGGHGLLVGAPGLAKTTLVDAVATAFGLDWRRIQFTPDLMPADIIGSEILDGGADGQRRFRFVPGPVFATLVMGDEVNRASPRTQSALLQSMQERHVTVAGQRYDLPEPFHVLATQNPIEQEGTYPLPEAQLDRFLLQINVPYPDAVTERSILLATTGGTIQTTKTVASTGELQRLQAFVRMMPVGEKVLETIISLVRSARPDESAAKAVRESVSWGPGPRAGQALILACKARALLRGRLAPSLDDVLALARPALAHRMALNWSARADGLEAGTLIETLSQKAIAP